MQANIYYDHYLSESNKQIIKNIEASLDGDIGLNLSVDRTDIENMLCQIKMYDKIGVSEIESHLDRNELRELITLLKQIYNQLEISQVTTK